MLKTYHTLLLQTWMLISDTYNRGLLYKQHLLIDTSTTGCAKYYGMNVVKHGS